MSDVQALSKNGAKVAADAMEALDSYYGVAAQANAYSTLGGIGTKDNASTEDYLRAYAKSSIFGIFSLGGLFGLAADGISAGPAAALDAPATALNYRPAVASLF